MSIVIGIKPARGEGVCAGYDIVLSSGIVIGSAEQTATGAFRARTPEGQVLGCGDNVAMFAELNDAAAAVWLGFMARCPGTGHTTTISYLNLRPTE